jgi:hypothetical protein
VNSEPFDGLSATVSASTKTKKKKKKKDRGTCLRSAKARESLISGGEGVAVAPPLAVTSNSSTSSATCKSDRFSCLAGPRIPHR